MNRKALILGSVLAASMAFGSTAQAHDDDYLPYGFIGGLWLGLELNHDHYRDHRWYDERYRHRAYPHREYRRSDSHGYQRFNKYKHNYGHDKYKHDRKRWD
jgi:hypothetical protein